MIRNNALPLRPLAALALLSLAAAAGLQPLPAAAQADDKSVVAESVPVLPAFSQWVNTLVVVAEPVPAAAVTTVPLPAAPVPAAAAPYEPWPVVLGNPELPLVGAGARQAARAWGSGFNYQGMHVKLLVLDASGRRVEVRPVAAPLQPGERFKIRVTTTFDAVADIGLVLGGPWTSQRAGQLYPAPGSSVQMNAGETVDLPLERHQYFVIGASGTEKLLLSVRHAAALGEARSQQPAYRQDSRGGSNYLQLVPRGTHPAIEQLVSTAAR